MPVLFLVDTVPTMADFISAVSSLFSQAISWVGTVASTIMNTPILLAFAALPLVGLGVGLFKRLLNVN